MDSSDRPAIPTPTTHDPNKRGYSIRITKVPNELRSLYRIGAILCPLLSHALGQEVTPKRFFQVRDEGRFILSFRDPQPKDIILKADNLPFKVEDADSATNHATIVLKGVPLEITCGEIKEELKAERTDRLRTSRGQLTQSVKVTCDRETADTILKDGLKVGFIRLRAERFIPFPRLTQCFQCQGFGHLARECPRKADPPICRKCTGAHRAQECKEAPKCANCDGEHPSSSGKCPKREEARKETINHRSYADVLATRCGTHLTGRHATKEASCQATEKPTRSVGTQTDLPEEIRRMAE
jgi:hypothetical protein